MKPGVIAAIVVGVVIIVAGIAASSVLSSLGRLPVGAAAGLGVGLVAVGALVVGLPSGLVPENDNTEEPTPIPTLGARFANEPVTSPPYHALDTIRYKLIFTLPLSALPQVTDFTPSGVVTHVEVDAQDSHVVYVDAKYVALGTQTLDLMIPNAAAAGESTMGSTQKPPVVSSVVEVMIPNRMRPHWDIQTPLAEVNGQYTMRLDFDRVLKSPPVVTDFTPTADDIIFTAGAPFVDVVVDTGVTAGIERNWTLHAINAAMDMYDQPSSTDSVPSPNISILNEVLSLSLTPRETGPAVSTIVRLDGSFSNVVTEGLVDGLPVISDFSVTPAGALTALTISAADPPAPNEKFVLSATTASTPTADIHVQYQANGISDGIHNDVNITTTSSPAIHAGYEATFTSLASRRFEVNQPATVRFTYSQAMTTDPVVADFAGSDATVTAVTTVTPGLSYDITFEFANTTGPHLLRFNKEVTTQAGSITMMMDSVSDAPLAVLPAMSLSLVLANGGTVIRTNTTHSWHLVATTAPTAASEPVDGIIPAGQFFNGSTSNFTKVDDVTWSFDATIATAASPSTFEYNVGDTAPPISQAENAVAMADNTVVGTTVNVIEPVTATLASGVSLTQHGTATCTLTFSEPLINNPTFDATRDFNLTGTLVAIDTSTFTGGVETISSTEYRVHLAGQGDGFGNVTLQYLGGNQADIAGVTFDSNTVEIMVTETQQHFLTNIVAEPASEWVTATLGQMSNNNTESSPALEGTITLTASSGAGTVTNISDRVYDTAWQSASNYTAATPALPTGVTTTTNITGESDIDGEWVQFALSESAVVQTFDLFVNAVGNTPAGYSWLGSSDGGTTWDLIGSFTATAADWSTSILKRDMIPSQTTAYNTYRIIVTSLHDGTANNLAEIAEINLWTVSPPALGATTTVGTFTDAGAYNGTHTITLQTGETLTGTMISGEFVGGNVTDIAQARLFTAETYDLDTISGPNSFRVLVMRSGETNYRQAGVVTGPNTWDSNGIIVTNADAGNGPYQRAAFFLESLPGGKGLSFVGRSAYLMEMKLFASTPL